MALSDGIRISILDSWPQDSPLLRLVIFHTHTHTHTNTHKLALQLTCHYIHTQPPDTCTSNKCTHRDTHTHTHFSSKASFLANARPAAKQGARPGPLVTAMWVTSCEYKGASPNTEIHLPHPGLHPPQVSVDSAVMHLWQPPPSVPHAVRAPHWGLPRLS